MRGRVWGQDGARGGTPGLPDEVEEDVALCVCVCVCVWGGGGGARASACVRASTGKRRKMIERGGAGRGGKGGVEN